MALDGRLLSNVSVLAAVVEGGNFARAADALGLTPSGVSRAIARLEARIGVRLLDRTTRSVSLTDEGRSLYANINPLVLGIEDAVTHTSGSSGSVRGRLRVNADAFTSRLLLSPSPSTPGSSCRRSRRVTTCLVPANSGSPRSNCSRTDGVMP